MGQKIGFIGLGIMGRPMSLHLMKAGHALTVYDIDREAVGRLAEAGARAASSPREAAEDNEIVITMLPASRHVEEVVLGEGGVLQGAGEGTVVIDMSSITPDVSKRIAAEVEKRGAEMLDAPVSGGEPKAIDGTLAIMVGGKESVFEQVKPVLHAMGKDVTLLGGHGSGVTAKLANQIIVNLNIAAMSEALVFAQKAGIDVETMYRAIRGGLAGSAVLDAKVPMILERNFAAGGSVAINLKDIRNVMDTAHGIGVPLPLSGQLLEIFHALRVDGRDKDDHCSIVRYYERLANTEVKRGGG